MKIVTAGTNAAQYHTPTPWTAHKHWVSLPGLARGINANSEANAAFIARACNSHDELVAALRGMIAHTHAASYALESRPETSKSLANADAYARAVLAKAGEA